MVIVMEEFNIPFDKAQTVNIYNESVKSKYVYGSAEYRKIMDCWNETVKGAHDMPAFGVSINNLTVKEMQKGVWLEFDFKKQLEHNGMPYEKLLIGVGEDYYGFNLIRFNSENGYEGRCFYYDLVDKNTAALYETLINLK